MKARVHIFVYGDVQGVFFRAGTISAASRLGLTGWVRNRTDGSVELTAEGEKDMLEELLNWCRQGPLGAAVENVKSEWEEYAGKFAGFTARPTA